MARKRATVRVNQFAGGLNTEANLLNFPDGVSQDEQNCDLLGNGYRRRRDGFNTDLGTPVDTTITYASGQRLGKNQFVWDNAGNIPTAKFLVVQIANYIGIHSLGSSVITNNKVFDYIISGASKDVSFGFASIDGTLVIVNGDKLIYKIDYDGTNFTVSTSKLLIRDLFGTETIYTKIENIQARPATINDAYLYNLRNQTFALPHREGRQGNSDMKDPVKFFNDYSLLYPSMADNVNYFLMANPNFEEDRLFERFDPKNMLQSHPGNTRAPLGYFIIDALDRGTSRMEEFQRLTNRHVELQWQSTVSLKTDRTPGGASVVAQYAGRVWYAGFSGSIVDGDEKSPKLSSYVLFSQVVKEPSQITLCYQRADPTSHEDADLVDTDGGFIKIDGAYNIQALVAADTSLFVFAENGVWRIVGESENNFSATNYSVSKVNNKGCIAKGSVVYVDGILMYWAENSIFAIIKSDVGDWKVEDVTENSIKSLYQGFSDNELAEAHGYYDDASNTIRWIYGESPDSRSKVGELIFNKKFQVFTKNLINLPSGGFGPITVSGGEVDGYTEEPVMVLDEEVYVGSEVVTTASVYGTSSASENFYCIINRLYPTITYSFGGYNNEDSPYDWDTVDSPAFLTTGFVTGGDGRYTKDVPYVTTYFHVEDNASCLLQSRWDWTGSASSGQWSNPRQIYRDIKVRPGDEVLASKNKIRGMGRSISLNYSSEPGKFFQIHGWEHNVNADDNE